VSLATRPRLWSILEALVDRHCTSQGAALAARDLAMAGWPTQDPDTSAAASRVYVAVSSLRKLGLEDFVVRSPSGYLLEVSTAVEDLDA
jgi:hypothetical protein